MARGEGFHLGEVIEARQVTPSMVRVTLGGRGLAGFASTGKPDERLGVYFPNPGTREPQRPTVTDGAWEFADPDDIPEGRSYTVRRARPDRGEIDIDFVVHEGGVASAWATRARPGDLVGLSDADGWFAPLPGTSRYLLVADATGLPAAARIIEEAPPGTRVDVIFEVPVSEDEQYLAIPHSSSATWLVGSGLGHAPSRLADAVRELGPLPDDTHVWVAAEASTTRAIRKHLRRDRGLPNARMTVIGYWRQDKEDFQRRYEARQDDLLRAYSTLVESGVQGQDLIEAWDTELERAGF
ncbi:siderophore-interacting protein [Hoyosella sp. G463]|uniref:Siderophore-interacting protein n=1 Tax=Lolliginicoccus lacisalsi TaxID=2742202 RepID=A0A927PML2_9ACTN|nr:siderophore-interacting protein [Lolliginicoccus lacisalsi]